MSVSVKETGKKSPIIPSSAFWILLCIPSGRSSLAATLYPLSCYLSGGAAPEPSHLQRGTGVLRTLHVSGSVLAGSMTVKPVPGLNPSAL